MESIVDLYCKKQSRQEKTVEYTVYYEDGDVDHVQRFEVLSLLERIPPDVIRIEKTSRWWEDDGKLVNEESDVLYDSGREVN